MKFYRYVTKLVGDSKPSYLSDYTVTMWTPVKRELGQIDKYEAFSCKVVFVEERDFEVSEQERE